MTFSRSRLALTGAAIFTLTLFNNAYGAAASAAADRLSFVQELIAALSLGLDLFNNGRADHGRYIPLSTGPLQQISDVSAATGLRQASVALAVLGRGAADGDWAVVPDIGNTAPLKLDQAGQETRVFF